MKLPGRTILVTGGASGIGLAFAKRFMELGNEVIVTGRRQHALDAVKASYPALHTIRSDAADIADVQALARRLKDNFPAFDVLMNNAGILLAKNLSHPADDLAGLTQELDINLAGLIRTTSALIDDLVARRGTIINVSSALAFAPVPALPVYCATKAAVHSYTQSLRFQLEDKGVEVIELMPPAVRTELSSSFPESGFKMLTTDQLVEQTFDALRKGRKEIRPGQSNLVAMMRRLAPDAINRQFWKASRGLVPA